MTTRKEMRGRLTTTAVAVSFGNGIAAMAFGGDLERAVDAAFYICLAVCIVWFYDVRKEFPQ